MMSEISNENILTIDHLSTVIHMGSADVKAVNDVSFTLKRGEILGLVGESGCGKSTVLRSILRLLDTNVETSGEILYNGQNILAMKKRELRRIRGREIGMIFQEPMVALNPVLKIKTQIYEQFLEKKLRKKEKLEKAVDALHGVEIPNPRARVEEYIHQFSGGMRQRTMIATALAAQPKILLADEPTTALDVTIQAQIMRLIKRLRRDFGMSIILVTHDLGVVSETCDKVVVMYAGKVVEIGSNKEVFSRPLHPYTQGLLMSIPQGKDKRSKLETIGGNPPDLTEDLTGCPFAPRCKYATEQCRKSFPQQQSDTPTHTVFCHHVTLETR